MAATLPHLRAILVSAHLPFDGRGIRHIVGTLRSETRTPAVLLGGPAFADRDRVGPHSRYGADAVLLTARDALATVSALTSPLTDREGQVLACVAEGMSNIEAARELRLAPSTVKDHVEAICRKLGASSRTAAVSAAMRRGLLS